MRNPVSRFSCWFTVVATAVVMTASAQPAGAQSSVDQLQGGLAHATSTPDKTLLKQYDPFYDDPVPAEQLDRPGKLLRAQPAPHLLNLLGPSFPGYAQRILYTSTTVDGRIVPVSGYMIEPANPWQGAGPTPTVVFGPGTRGAGDGCAPSRGPWMMGQIDPAQPTVGTNYETLHHQAAALMGMRVVVSDLIGLGTPGAHTYVLHTEEGHALIDAARATTQPHHPVGFWGYSQGGGASAAAAELAPSYAPDLNVKGAFAGAPPADLVETMRGVDNSSILAVVGFALNGWTERYPEFKPALDANLNARGREFLESTRDACMADSAARWGFQDSRTFTVSGEPMVDVLTRYPEIRRKLDEQKLGHRAPQSPVMVSTLGGDMLVPTPQVIQLARDYCAAGANVTLLNDAVPALTPPLKIGINHAAGVFAHTVPSLKWLADRFNGVSNASNCGVF